MNKYRVVKDLQGGEFGMGRDYTAEEWLEQAVEWRDSDGWEDDEREEYTKFWEQRIKDGKEQELIDYIAETWQLEFEKVKGE